MQVRKEPMQLEKLRLRNGSNERSGHLWWLICFIILITSSKNPWSASTKLTATMNKKTPSLANSSTLNTASTQNKVLFHLNRPLSKKSLTASSLLMNHSWIFWVETSKVLTSTLAKAHTLNLKNYWRPAMKSPISLVRSLKGLPEIANHFLTEGRARWVIRVTLQLCLSTVALKRQGQFVFKRDQAIHCRETVCLARWAHLTECILWWQAMTCPWVINCTVNF